MQIKKVPDRPLYHFLAPSGPAVVRANMNPVTKRRGLHVSVCVPFVVSLTPTTNQFPHHLPSSMGSFHNPKHISSFLTQSWRITNRSCVWGLAWAASVGAPHAVCLEMKGWWEPSCCHKQTAHTTNNAALGTTTGHMVALSWTLCQQYIV